MTLSSKRPKRASMLAMEPPGTYSRKMYSAFSSRRVPTYRTMFGCLNVLSRPTCNSGDIGAQFRVEAVEAPARADVRGARVDVRGARVDVRGARVD
eukprot:8316696-Pyramimonas_sp.AAC.1